MSFSQTPHKVLPFITPEQIIADPARAKELIILREEAIAREKGDPFWYCYEPPMWAKARELAERYRNLLIMGGNRSSKSTFAGKFVQQVLVGRSSRRGWCFQTTAATSIEMQQPIMNHFIPLGFRAVKGRQAMNMKFSQKNGFSEASYVLPNASQCFFKNYAQDITTIEGGEIDVAWCDELVPLEWLRTISYRLLDRDGIMIVTFTPIDGYTATVKHYLSGARTMEWADADLLIDPVTGKKERVPLWQETADGTAAIIYFHTEGNPYAGYGRLKRELAGKSREEILCRAYGVPVKSIASKFPLFREAVHVVSPQNIPTTGTDYLFVDPAGTKNWFMIWVRFDGADRAYVVREWPQADAYIPGVGMPGAWTVPGVKLDGEFGDGQKSFGWGLQRYREEIERIETEEGYNVFERWMDSRYGNTSVAGTRENATTLIEEMDEVGMTFRAAPGENIEEGVGMINDWLHFRADVEVGHMNSPRLYISSRCANLIYSLKEWTGADGTKGASKDPIDVLRYMVMSGVCSVEGGALNVRGGGSY